MGCVGEFIPRTRFSQHGLAAVLDGGYNGGITQQALGRTVTAKDVRREKIADRLCCPRTGWWQQYG